MNHHDRITAAFAAALETASQAQRAGDMATCLRQLERAHLIGQSRFTLHTRVHWRMLCLAVQRADGGEALGQLFRLSLVPLGHLLGRLPLGNVGSTRMGAFDVAPLPDDIAELLREPAEHPGQV